MIWLDYLIKPALALLGTSALGALAVMIRRVFRWAREKGDHISETHAAVPELHRELHETGTAISVLLENGRYGSAKCDLEGNFLETNDNFCRMVGALHSELLDRGWESFVTPEDLKRHDMEWLPAIQHGREFTADLMLLHSEGHAVPTTVCFRKFTDRQRVPYGYRWFISPVSGGELS